MKDEKGAALLLESAMILPAVLFIVIVIYFSTIYVIQKNLVFAKGYHYSRVVSKMVAKPQVAFTQDNNFNMTKQDYVNSFHKLQPYTFLSKKKMPFQVVAQHIESDLQQKNIIQLNQPTVSIMKKSALIVPKIITSIRYQTPIIKQLTTFKKVENTEQYISEGFVSMSPVINPMQFKNNIQLAKQLSKHIEQTKVGQKMKDIWHRINYFLNKIRR